MTVKKGNNRKNIGMVLLIWLIVFNPPLIPGINIIYILGAISLVYLLVNKVIKREFLLAEFFSVLCIIYLMLIENVNESGENYSIYLALWIEGVIPSAFMVAHMCKRNKISYDQFEEIIIASGVLAALFAVVSLVSPVVHETFLKAMLNSGVEEKYINNWGFRMHGFASNLTYGTPIAMAIMALLSLKRMIFTKQLKYIVYMLLLVSMAFVSARTSLVVFMGGVLVLGFLNCKRMGRLFIVFLVMILVVIGAFVGLTVFMEDSEYSQQITWLYDGLLNVFSPGNEEKQFDSVGYFLDAKRYVLPDTIPGLIFGRGEIIMEGSTTGAQSDIGFINDIWLGGLAYFVTSYIFLSVLLMHCYKNLKEEDKKNAMQVISIIVCSILIANIKGRVMSFNNIVNLIFIIIAFSSRGGMKNGKGNNGISFMHGI